MSEALTYGSYLKLPELLSLQEPRADGPEHDETLFISVNTVAAHVRNILAKTGTSNRTEAAAFANQHGLLVDLPDKK